MTGEAINSRVTEAAAVLAAVSDKPRLDAELLLAHALGVEREELLTWRNPFALSEVEGLGREGASTSLSPSGLGKMFSGLIERRLRHEPVAYIVGKRAFWTIELEVTPEVLIPRPDSETLLEAAVAWFGENGPERVLDLGTGSGVLLLAALDQWPEAFGIGVDRSAEALAVARRNALRIAPGRAELRRGDWGDGIEDSFDLLLCNPPYVEQGAALSAQVRDWEPHAALFAGPDGLDCYRKLSGQIPRLVTPKGLACVEVGAGQADAVEGLFAGSGMKVTRRRDLGGHVRCLAFSWRQGLV